MSDGDAEATAKAIEQLAAREKRIEAKPDGSLVVRLLSALKIGGSERTSVTIAVAKVRAIRLAQRAVDAGEPNLLDAYADQLVEPPLAHNEIENMEDHDTVRLAVDQQLGKFLGTGRDS